MRGQISKKWKRLDKKSVVKTKIGKKREKRKKNLIITELGQLFSLSCLKTREPFLLIARFNNFAQNSDVLYV